MGEVRVKVSAANPVRPKADAVDLDCLVDTGAVMMMLPRDVIDKLDVEVTGRAVVTLANETSEEMDIAGPFRVRIGDRQIHLDSLVGPLLSEPLIGQMVLEGLDLIVDCPNRTLSPRPESPAFPSFKLK